jgi:hypothetical protein
VCVFSLLRHGSQYILETSAVLMKPRMCRPGPDRTACANQGQIDTSSTYKRSLISLSDPLMNTRDDPPQIFGRDQKNHLAMDMFLGCGKKLDSMLDALNMYHILDY